MRFIVFLAVVFLSGCSAFSKPAEEFACPKTGFIEETTRVTFLQGADVSVQAGFNGFTGDCSFKNMGIAEMNLTLPVVAKKGPAGAALKKVELPYFIALLSPDEQILQRESFTAEVDFDNDGIGQAAPEHVLKIPVTSAGDAHKYKVVIGFILTPEQLAYNKEKK